MTLESWAPGNEAYPVRRRADGKGLPEQYLAGGLSYRHVRFGGRPSEKARLCGTSLAAHPTHNLADALERFAVRVLAALRKELKAEDAVDTAPPPAPSVSSTDFPQNQWSGRPAGPGTVILSTTATDALTYLYDLDRSPPARAPVRQKGGHEGPFARKEP